MSVSPRVRRGKANQSGQTAQMQQAMAARGLAIAPVPIHRPDPEPTPQRRLAQARAPRKVSRDIDDRLRKGGHRTGSIAFAR